MLRSLHSAAASKPIIGSVRTPKMATFIDRILTLGGRQHQSQHQTLRFGHTVRVILLNDLPTGKAFRGDVIRVKAGYARNMLIPKKYAMYATQKNFDRIGMRDPEDETPEEKKLRLQMEAATNTEERRQADRLRKYLAAKNLTMVRKADNVTGVTSPGHVSVKHLRDKLSKHLKIDLEDHEAIHIAPKEIPWDETTSLEELDILLEEQLGPWNEREPVEPCKVELRKVGEYVARISLRAGFTVPLKFSIVPRP